MEQVLAPHVNFKSKNGNESLPSGTIAVGGFKEPSKKVRDIIESDLNDLKAAILQDDLLIRAMPGNVEPEIINKVLIPKIIRIKYPELSESEVEELRQHVVVDSVIKNGEIKQVGDKRFVRMADQFINIDDLHIDLIDKVNPFQKAFEVLSKSVTARLLKVIGETIESQKIAMTDEEAVILYKDKITLFIKKNNRQPDINSNDPLERRMAEAIVYLKNKARQLKNTN
jgi:hypothetical protein